MIEVRIREVAESRGITTAYQLQKALDLYPSVASRLFNGTFKQISIETIDKLCTVLDVDASELFRRVPENEETQK
jgi:DNA-binding Xre family transcriptional regulator